MVGRLLMEGSAPSCEVAVLEPESDCTYIPE